MQVFIVIHGRVVSVRGQPFLYAGVSFRMQVWAVVFERGWLSSYTGGCLHMWVVAFGSYDGGGVWW
jgi:hypothetical protein